MKARKMQLYINPVDYEVISVFAIEHKIKKTEIIRQLISSFVEAYSVSGNNHE